MKNRFLTLTLCLLMLSVIGCSKKKLGPQPFPGPTMQDRKDDSGIWLSGTVCLDWPGTITKITREPDHEMTTVVTDTAFVLASSYNTYDEAKPSLWNFLWEGWATLEYEPQDFQDRMKKLSEEQKSLSDYEFFQTILVNEPRNPDERHVRNILWPEEAGPYKIGKFNVSLADKDNACPDEIKVCFVYSADSKRKKLRCNFWVFYDEHLALDGMVCWSKYAQKREGWFGFQSCEKMMKKILAFDF